MANFLGTEKKMEIWAEKYRPETLEDYIGNDHIKSKVERYIEENDISHLLFYSKKPGTGKTSLAKIIVDNIDCDYMYINASDENSVDTMRNKIKHYASSVAMNNLKIIILDEADFLSPQSQAALRRIMEDFADTTRFILCANYHDKIVEPVVSRTQSFKVLPPKKSDVAKKLAGILANEGVSYNKDQLALIVNQYYPDIRKVLNNAQQNTIDGELQINEEDMVESSYEMKLVELLKDDSKGKNELFKEIRELTAESPIDSYSEIYRYLFDNVDQYAKGNVAEVYLQLAESLFQDSMTTDGEITFSACIIEIIDLIR